MFSPKKSYQIKERVESLFNLLKENQMVNQNLLSGNHATLKAVCLIIATTLPLSLLGAIFLQGYFSMTFWEFFAASTIGGISGGTAVWRLAQKRKIDGN
jgi:hypothetical protein